MKKAWHWTLKKLRSWHPVPSLHGKEKGESGSSDRFYFLELQKSVDGDRSHEIKRCLLLGRKAMTNLDSILKSKNITLLTQVCIVKAMVFPVVMYRCKLDHKEDWAPNWGFQIVLLEKTLESLLHYKEIKSVNPKINKPRIFISRTIVEAPILWQPDVKCQFIGKDPEAGKNWRQKEKGATKYEMIRQHRQLNGREFEQLWEIMEHRGA